MTRKVTIFGATGSIGQNTLDLIRRNRDQFEIVALTGGRNVDQLIKDALEFRPSFAVTSEESLIGVLQAGLAGSGIAVGAGRAALLDAANMPADWTMSAIVGSAGLEPGLRSLQHGGTLALANKESLVAAGPILLAEAKAKNATVLPVDSEHSAIFQALIGEDVQTVERVIITASGGAFRDWPLERIANATPAQAATHPNWDMGQRITIDSASMFNKALEVIETKEYFGLKSDQIEVLVHPQSLIHAFVGFNDGGLLAHVGPPDMRHAIGFALNWPKRRPLPVERLDFTKIQNLEFRAPDPAKYPALSLAYEVMSLGGHAGAIFNAAKEQALDAFLAHQIGFLDMADVVERVLGELTSQDGLNNDVMTLDTVANADQMARQRASEIIVSDR